MSTDTSQQLRRENTTVLGAQNSSAGADTTGVAATKATQIAFLDKGGLTLDGVQVQLIFWGSSWNNQSSPSVNDITNAVTSILAGPYMSGLRQYPVANKGMLSGTLMVTTQIGSSPADPPQPFTNKHIETLLSDLLNTRVLPEPEPNVYPLYCVMLPSGMQFDQWAKARVNGEHSFFFNLWHLRNVHYAWITDPTSNGLDIYSTVFSHELVEACTNPNGSGFLGTPGMCEGSGWCEIGDVCEGQTSILDGITVQAYWSQSDYACIVPHTS